MKRLPLFCVVLVLAACARDKKTTTSAAASTAADAVISPSDAPGLYLDSARAKLFQKSGHILEEDCTASADARAEAVKVFLFAKNNGIFAYSRNSDVGKPDGHDLYYSFDHGKLVPQRPELKAPSAHATEFSLHRKGKHVRVHFSSKDLKTGASSETDQSLALISEATARDFLGQEAACAARPVAEGRLTQFALGVGHVTQPAPGGSPGTDYLGLGTEDPITCEVSGTDEVISAGSKFSLSVPTTDAFDGTPQRLKANDPRLRLQFPDLHISSEDCTSRVKRTGGVLEAVVHCGSIEGVEISIACPRQAENQRQ